MCGIAGLLYTGSRESTLIAVRRMLDAEKHRGPDDCGVHAIQEGAISIGLGSRRLAILELSDLGHQPMCNSETGDVLAYNGEIYNYLELKKDLTELGYGFRGASDTEVLLRAYQHWGTDCLTRLSGMFAFALWDKRRARLVLARDQLGIKPLYFGTLPKGGFIFGSEVRAMLASGFLPFNLDPRAIASYLAYGSIQGPLTIISGLESLEPAMLMEVTGAGQIAKKQRYWTFPSVSTALPGRQAGEFSAEGRGLWRRAVRRHLLSDVWDSIAKLSV